MKRGTIDNFLRMAHAHGEEATTIVRANVFGTRYTPYTNAGTSDHQTVGIGKHSVWQGPEQILSGAPVLKRDRSA